MKHAYGRLRDLGTNYECVQRYFFGVLFLFTGISKSFHVTEFASEVSQYASLYISHAVALWSDGIALLVCATEIALGLLLFVGRLAKITSIITFAIMSFFLYLTGVNYLYPSVIGRVETCGCFGEIIHLSAGGSFLKNIALWLMSLALFCVVSPFGSFRILWNKSAS